MRRLYFFDTPGLDAFTEMEVDVTIKLTKAPGYVLEFLHDVPLQELRDRHGKMFQVSFG